MIEYEYGICEWYNLEGQVLTGTKKEYERYCETLNKMWDIAKPTVTNFEGRIVMYGTGGNIDNDT